MKRSEINQIMRRAQAFIRERGMYLPPFAYWTPEDWQRKGPEVSEIVQNHLGWDITDFGQGDFNRTGLFMFTVRNGSASHPSASHPGEVVEGSASHPVEGSASHPSASHLGEGVEGSPADAPHGTGKQYAEKLLIVEEGQVTPMHFHWNKMEDIINRGGGTLVVKLYNADASDGLAETPVQVSLDGVQYDQLPAGSVLSLEPGESITLTPRLYHSFWAEGGRTLLGEVSLVNDDYRDNHFLSAPKRFPAIEADESPLYLLMTDYAAYYEGSASPLWRTPGVSHPVEGSASHPVEGGRE